MVKQLSDSKSRVITSAFISELKPWYINRFYYTLVPQMTPDGLRLAQCEDSLNWKRLFSLHRLRFAIASDPDTLVYRDEYLKRYSNKEMKQTNPRSEGSRINRPIIWHKPNLHKSKEHGYRQLHKRYEIGSKVVFFNKIPMHSDILGLCVLFSPLDEPELKSHFESKDIDELSRIISKYSQELHALSAKQLNPLANFSVLSPTGIKVLELVSEGYSSEEISRMLHLTDRGVNYHLDRAREVLSARNRTNLISKAHRQGLLW